MSASSMSDWLKIEMPRTGPAIFFMNASSILNKIL